MLEEMKRIALERGVVLTDNAEKIARVRERLGLSICDCPCASSEEEKLNRGCISAMCYREIMEQGICKCRAYKRAE